MTVGEGTFASLFIGNDFSRIDIYSKNNLVMTRGIKTGISSMMEAIDESIAETLPGKKLDKERVKKILHDLSDDPGKSLKDEDGIHWNENTISGHDHSGTGEIDPSDRKNAGILCDVSRL